MGAYETMLTKIWGIYRDLSLYELTFKANNALLAGDDVTPEDKRYIVSRFLNGVSSKSAVANFHRGVCTQQKKNSGSRQMYPLFYIPPYGDGKKYVTLSTVTPKTHILSANAYELEILRLLALLAPNDGVVCAMLDKTYERISATCFGRFCSAGECFEAGLPVLRFLGTAFPNELGRMEKLIYGFNKHFADKKRHSGVITYYWLALSELPAIIAESEIRKYKGELESMIKRSFVMNGDKNRYTSPFGVYVFRNCLLRLDEYAYLLNRKPYVSSRDGRIYMDLTPELYENIEL